MSYETLVQGFIIPNLVDKYKIIFGEGEANLGTLQKFFPILNLVIHLFGVWEKSQLTVIIIFSNFVNVEYSTVKYPTGDNVKLTNLVFATVS